MNTQVGMFISNNLPDSNTVAFFNLHKADALGTGRRFHSMNTGTPTRLLIVCQALLHTLVNTRL